jgi:SpoVK/Ycf46/Vps4 family AAA+-type ATPase
MTTTRSQRVNADIAALLRARNSLLWVTTREEGRVERAIIEAAGSASYDVRFWDCKAGLTDAMWQAVGPGQELADPNAIVDYIRDTRDRAVYVMRDVHDWMDPIVKRALRSLARILQTTPRAEARAIIVLTPSTDIPPELAGHATVLDYPLPERTEIAAILDDVVKAAPPDMQLTTNGAREAAIDAAVGLTAEEAASTYAKSLVTLRAIDPASVSAEKKRVIARDRLLTWYDPDARGLDAIGGLGLFKPWVVSRLAAFSKRARDYGLPAPKGVLLVGPPGTGKSLAAKCIPTAWGVPLLRIDLGALRSKYVGESESNIRAALAVAETVAPCVLWIDEIEKALAGATGPQGDGGVGADALGAILSWMQERAGAVFVVATANDVRALPPELLRKGRFDELFFIDLPTRSERAEILAATLRSFDRDPDTVDLDAVASVTDGFTGAEIAALVPDALFAAFADDERAITTDDLRTVAGTVAPLSRTASEKLDSLRTWAKGRTRPASTPETTDTSNVRSLDL